MNTQELIEALGALVDRDVAYSAHEVIIPTNSHTEAILLIQKARKALAKARAA